MRRQASSGSSSSARPSEDMPALFTRMSILPSCSTTWPTNASISSTRVTSTLPKSDRRPSAASSPRRAWPSSSSRSQIATSAPASASASAICRPSPRAPPVTMATWPVEVKRSSTLMAAPARSCRRKSPCQLFRKPFIRALGEGVLVEQAHELHPHRADVGAGHGDLAEEPRVAAAGQDLGLEAVVVVDLAHRRDHVVRRVLRLIQRAVEDRGDVGAGLGGQVRLRQGGDRRDRQAQVGQLGLELLQRLQAGDAGRQLDDDLRSRRRAASAPGGSSARDRASRSPGQRPAPARRPRRRASVFSMSGPAAAIRPGLVVTPQSRPHDRASRISLGLELSRKRSMIVYSESGRPTSSSRSSASSSR